MYNEHNPIAVLISRLQQQWITEVSPVEKYKLIRWLMRQGEARLYEGLLRLESSVNGQFPEVVVVLLTSFTSAQSHSAAIIKDWIDSFRGDEKTFQELKAQGVEFFWDVTRYEALLGDKATDPDKLLLEMLTSFQKALPDPATRLVLALFPYLVSDTEAYSQWLSQLMQRGIPDKVMLMVFDSDDDRHFDRLFKQEAHQVRTIRPDINLSKAMSQLATAGDSNAPDVQFRKCVMEMGNAVKDNNLTRLHLWGKKGLEITQRTGSNHFFATAHLTYAGMLFTFKKTAEIEQLLDQGLRIARKGLQLGDAACQSLIILHYGYLAACRQQNGKNLEAADLYTQQGELALQYQQSIQALAAWWQAYNLYEKTDTQKYTDLLTRAYETGTDLLPEELQTSCMIYIGFDYYQYCHNLKQKENCLQINQFMTSLAGSDWMETARKYKEDTKKKKRFFIV